MNICSAIVDSDLFNEDKAVKQLQVILFTSHHTPAQSIIGALYTLYRHPEKQKRLRDEVHRKLPSINNNISAAVISNTDFKSIPYLNAVYKEVLYR